MCRLAIRYQRIPNFFFEINISSTEKNSSVWEASKEYIRGKIIAHASKMKKENVKKENTLNKEIRELEKWASHRFLKIFIKIFIHPPVLLIQKTQTFFSCPHLPTVSNKQKDMLDAQITEEEFRATI